MSRTEARDVGALTERLTTVLLLVAAAAIAGKYAISAVSEASPAAPATTAPVGPLTIRGAFEGSRDSPVVVLEFSDFQCPFCGKFVRETLPGLRARYIDSGKARFVFNHFPLEAIHPLAFKAALVAECSRQQDAFWPMHDAMFGEQQALGDLVADPGQMAWLDSKKLAICIDSELATKAVRSDIELGKQLHLTGTPAFFVGTSMGPDLVKVHQVMFGSVTIDAISKAIDSLLHKE